MRIRMISGNRATMDAYPNLTIEFADSANEDIANEVIDLLIRRAGNKDDLEESNEACSMPIPRIHGRTGGS